MKIVVVHGEDTVKSRLRYSTIVEAIKKRGWSTIVVPREGGANLADTVREQSLFGSETLYRVDDGTSIPSSQIKALKTLIDDFQGSLLIYFDKKLTSTVKKLFPPKTKFEEFELPKIIFLFLESLYPGRAREIINYLDKMLVSQAPEFIVAVVAKHLRDVYWVKIGAEGLSYPGWRISKLSRQSQKFSEGHLERIIDNLAQIDIEAKRSGSSSMELLKLLVLREF